VAETLPIVVPVRYSGGGLTMQSTSSRLSAEGVFVRGVVTPKAGAQIAIQLTLPGAPRPLEVRGTVADRVLPGDKGKEAGFWVRFEAMSDEGRGVLAALLRDRSAPGGAAKRAFVRIPVRLQVSWPTARDFLIAYADNISVGGIYVVTPDPPALGEVVDLSLQLPDGPAPAKTKAAVIQRLDADQAKQLRRQPGAGLQFVGSDDEFRRRLDQCIENLLAQPLG
jgi:uncharacterized protein (TIGR02266 family)